MADEEHIGGQPIELTGGKLYSADAFLVPSNCAPYIKGVLVPGGLIRDRVDKMGYDIRKHYKNGELHALCLLKGSYTFFGALCSSIHKQEAAGVRFSLAQTACGLELFRHFVQISTYKNTAATGEVKFIADDLTCVKGKDVLIVDDVVETGNTVKYILDWLANFEPRSIRTASLIQLRNGKQVPQIDFVGFRGPKEWLVGYGIDYNGFFRELAHVCVLNDEAKKALAV